MKRRFPLAAVLRVRQAAEEAARAEAAKANARVSEVAERAARREASLQEQTLPADVPVTAFLGSVTATRSIAMEVSALNQLTKERRDELAAAQESWTSAEQARGGVDSLAERHLLSVQHELREAEQRELDELAQHPRRIVDWDLPARGET